MNGFKAAKRLVRPIRAVVEKLEERRLLSAGTLATIPSLAAILRDDNIPTIVGDGPNDANAFAGPNYPAAPHASSQEIAMPRLVKAGDGAVTITTLADFAGTNQPVLRFGYYVPGDPADTTQLFSINQSDSQSLNRTPQGATSFDPGASDFGLYANFPTLTDNGHQRMSYSEDALNMWDASVPRKIRFFPLENAEGSIVPNAYIFACEENGSSYQFNDLVGIIYNVKPAADGAVLGLQNLSGAPSTTRMVFNRIQSLNPADPAGFVDIVHDQNTLQIQNTGDQPLVISGLNLSDTNWQFVNPPALPATVPVGGSIDVTVKFVATSDPPHTGNQINSTATVNGISVNAAGGVANGLLTILSNDPLRPSRTIQLAGFWQDMSENENEPGLNTITNLLFGYGTTIGGSTPDLPNNGTTPVYYGQEVSSAFWYAADPTLPVTVRQLAVYHSQFSSTTGAAWAANIGWYPQGGSHQTLFQDEPGESQSVLPTVNGSLTAPAASSFSPAGAFGWNLDGENSLDSANITDISLGRSGHAVRFYPARDSSGNLIPSTWLVVMDYQNMSFANSDYQDNVYLVSNMRPATQAPAPGGVQATASANGIVLQWQPVSDPTLAGYNIYRSTSSTGTYVKLNASPVTSFSYVDSSVAAGATSYYRITSIDTIGESQAINASATAAPAVPTNLVATVLSGRRIQLDWSPSPTSTSYDIRREVAGGTQWIQFATGVTATSFTDAGLSSAITYIYEVRASAAAGASGYSVSASATTLPLPAAPSNLVATGTGETQINLSWTDNTAGSAGFDILRASASSGFVQIATLAPGIASYADTQLTPGTVYAYEVLASNANGQSTFLNTASAGTFYDITIGLGSAKSLKFTDPDGTAATLTWKGPGSAVVELMGGNLSQSSSRGIITVGGAATVANIHADATTLATSLTVTAHGGNNAIDVGGFIADAAFGRLIAPAANFSGSFTVAGSANSIITGSINGLSATFGGTLVSFSTGRTGSAAISAGGIHSLNLGRLSTSKAAAGVAVTAHGVLTLAGSLGATKFSLHRLIAPANPAALLLAKGISTSDILIRLN